MVCLNGKKKKVLVTGGAGFIGSHITRKLLQNNWMVTVIDDLSSGKVEHIPVEALFICQDIRDTILLDKLFEAEKFDMVVHLAAQTMVPVSIKNPRHDCELNLLATIGVLEQCRKHSVGKIVFASSAAVYGSDTIPPAKETAAIKPMSFYGLSKYGVECYLRLYHQIYGLKYAALRFANVYGERQGDGGEGGVVSIFTRLLCQNQTLHIYGDGRQTRDFIYAGDVAAAVVASMSLEVPSGTYNVSTGRQISILELIECLSNVAQKIPNVNKKNPRVGDILHSALDPRAIQMATGWKACMPLAEGLRRTYQYKVVKG